MIDKPIPVRDRASLILVCLLVSLPFLQPTHHEPIPSFYEDWLAIVLGICAGIALWSKRGLSFTLPSATLLPGLLILAAAMHLFGKESLYFRNLAWIQIGFLAWSVLVASIGATLTRRIGREAVFRGLAKGLFIGAALSACLAFAQRFQVELPIEWVFPETSARMSANMAQPNLLTSYLWLGAFAAMHLHLESRLSRTIAVFGLILLGGAMGLATSRLSLVQGGALLILIILAPLPAKSVRGAMVVVTMLSAILLPQVVTFLAPPLGTALFESPLSRLSTLAVNQDARLDLWRDTLAIVLSHPFAGNGAGSFAWRMFEATGMAPPGAQTYPGAEHAHNVFLQIAADFGLIVLAATIMMIAFWTIRLFRQVRYDVHVYFGICLLAILGVHSLLEYPLWYAAFLGIFGLVAGAIDPRLRDYEFSKLRFGAPIILSASFLILIPALFDYRNLDHASNRPPAMASAEEWKWRVATVADIAKHSVVSPYAYVALGSLIEPEKHLSIQQSKVCEHAMRVWPDPVIIAKCAALRFASGHEQDAIELLSTANAAFRDQPRRDALRATLALAAKKIPEASNLGDLVEKGVGR